MFSKKTKKVELKDRIPQESDNKFCQYCGSRLLSTMVCSNHECPRKIEIEKALNRNKNK